MAERKSVVCISLLQNWKADKQMDSDCFSMLTGLRKSIDLVFGIITGVFQKDEGYAVSVLL